MGSVKDVIITSGKVDTSANVLCLLAMCRAKGESLVECSNGDENCGMCTLFHVEQKYMLLVKSSHILNCRFLSLFLLAKP